MTELEIFPEALAEAEEARRWYAERSQAAEGAFLDELDHAIAVARDAPNRWPRHMAGTRRYVLTTFPYALVYLFDDEGVHVVAFAHEKRRPGYWRKRLSSRR